MVQIVAISSGPETHIDHLAPICELLDIPLLLTEPDHLEISKKFYPMIEAEYIPLAELSLQKIASDFDVVIQTASKFWAMEIQPALKLFFDKELKVIFSPHGNSDKESFINEPVEHELEFVYGPQMKRLILSKDFIETGNLRLFFYQKYKSHFDSLAAPFFNKKKKTILYAPTWESKAANTSFFDEIDSIVEKFSMDFHLLVKPHPHLEKNDPGRYHYILENYKDRVQFLLDFPAIYPLLEKTDIYLGDFSSIGYDFLYYDRPLFFLREGGALQQAGKQFAGSFEDTQLELSSTRKKLYEDVFGKGVFPEKIRALTHEKLGPKNQTTLQ